MNLGTFQPGNAAQPSSTIELSVSCSNLADQDLVSKSDPVCVLYTSKSDQSKQWMEVGRTERLMDTLNPAWEKKFVLQYEFERRQVLKFAVYDWDGESMKLQAHDFLGQLECSLAEVVALQSRGFEKKLEGKGGKIMVRAEELSSNKEVVKMKFSGKNLDKKDVFGKSDPYLEISRVNENNQYTVVHRTEVIKNSLNPEWKQFEMEVRSLCNGDYDRQLKFDVFDADDDGSHDLIGSFQTNLRQLSKGSGPENVYDCINEKKKKKKGSKYKNSGNIMLMSITIEVHPSFLDFIQNGTQVNFTLAVDFTGSNGNPSNPSSLHYMDPTGRPNQYITAIQAVGEIIQDYDSDKTFPCLGFGARIPPNGEVSHEFFLTLDPNNPYCQGIAGIQAAYSHSIRNVQLYGPTNFSPVINHVAQFARAYQTNPSNYFVLLIITDGAITDLEDTKRSIINASGLPMSIIIIGVGDADFSTMDALDGDGKLLQSHGTKARRDIVQFVELQKFIQPGYGWNKELLAKAVLAEIPGQLTKYMKMQGFQPPQVRR